MIGKKINRLKVLEYSKTNNLNKKIWKCVCDCGNITFVSTGDLNGEHTKSCGCLRKQITGKRARTHGFTKTRLYSIWKGMKQRCNNPNNPNYKNYGGRGVKISDEWKTMKAFGAWALSNGYKDNLTIDRIDNEGNYEPNNCRWVTYKTQMNNTRRNRFINYKGKTKSVYNWSKEIGLSHKTITYRLNQNWPIEKVLSTKNFNFKKNNL